MRYLCAFGILSVLVGCGNDNAQVFPVTGTVAGLRNASPPPADDLVIAAFRDYAIPLSIVTPDLRFAAANGAYCRVLGYSEAELVGKTIADLSHPDDRSSSVRTANELFTGAVKEFRLKKRTGGEAVITSWWN